MDSVTVRAHRRLTIAARNRLAMDALHKFLLHGLVTLGTGRGHVETEDRRFVVGGSENLVRAMTIRADRSFLRACRDRLAVHALQVREKGWALWPLASMTYF